MFTMAGHDIPTSLLFKIYQHKKQHRHVVKLNSIPPSNIELNPIRNSFFNEFPVVFHTVICGQSPRNAAGLLGPQKSPEVFGCWHLPITQHPSPGRREDRHLPICSMIVISNQVQGPGVFSLRKPGENFGVFLITFFPQQKSWLTPKNGWSLYGCFPKIMGFPPKSSHFNRDVSIIFTIQFWGKDPYFWKHAYQNWCQFPYKTKPGSPYKTGIYHLSFGICVFHPRKRASKKKKTSNPNGMTTFLEVWDPKRKWRFWETWCFFNVWKRKVVICFPGFVLLFGIV